MATTTKVKSPLALLVQQGRQATGLTQTALAEHTGVTKYYINAIENDRETPKNPETLRQIAAAIGLNSDDLFFAAARMPDDIIDWALAHPDHLRAVRQLTQEEK